MAKIESMLALQALLAGEGPWDVRSANSFLPDGYAANGDDYIEEGWFARPRGAPRWIFVPDGATWGEARLLLGIADVCPICKQAAKITDRDWVYTGYGGQMLCETYVCSRDGTFQVLDGARVRSDIPSWGVLTNPKVGDTLPGIEEMEGKRAFARQVRDQVYVVVVRQTVDVYRIVAVLESEKLAEVTLDWVMGTDMGELP